MKLWCCEVKAEGLARQHPPSEIRASLGTAQTCAWPGILVNRHYGIFISKKVESRVDSCPPVQEIRPSHFKSLRHYFILLTAQDTTPPFLAVSCGANSSTAASIRITITHQGFVHSDDWRQKFLASCIA